MRLVAIRTDEQLTDLGPKPLHRALCERLPLKLNQALVAAMHSRTLATR
jgi:hypothetical protein